MRRISFQSILLFCLIALIAAAAVLAPALHAALPASSGVFIKGDPVPLDSGWTCSRGGEEIPVEQLPFSLPADGAESCTFSVQLPEQLPERPAVFLTLQYHPADLLLDGEKLCSFPEERTALGDSLVGNAPLTVSLPESAAGKTLSVVLHAPNPNCTFRFSGVTLDHIDSLFYAQFRSNFGLLLICLICGVVGLLCLAVELMCALRRIVIPEKCFLLSGLFILLVTLWMLTDSNLFPLFVSEPELITFLSSICFMLMPVPLLLLVHQLMPVGRQVLGFCSGLMLLNCAVLTALQLFTPLCFTKTLVCTHILFIGTLLTLLVLVVKNHRRFDRRWRVLLVGVLLFCLFGLLNLICFYGKQGSSNSMLVRIGLFCFIVLLVYFVLREALHRFDETIENSTLLHLAYIDPMTGLANRAAYIRDQSAIESGELPTERLTLVMFDLNNLKRVNDRFGHAAGDSLICGIAACMQKGYGAQHSCYRLGGDEFLVMLRDCSAEELQSLHACFERAVLSYNRAAEHTLSIAWGAASGSAPDNRIGWVDALLTRADRAMYDCKKRQKAVAAETERGGAQI